MLSNLFLYWYDALAQFCWALYFMGKIILLTIPRRKKNHAAMPLIISSSGGKWQCKQTHNIAESVVANYTGTLPVSSLISYSQINHGKNIQCTTEGDQHPESLHFNVQCSASPNLALVLRKHRHKSHNSSLKRLRAPSHSKLNASECSQQLWNIF